MMLTVTKVAVPLFLVIEGKLKKRKACQRKRS
jgi:surface polysaccharide O-acyltransferase-like enzyme